MILDQRLASENLGREQTGFDAFNEASSTRTIFASEYSPGGELQAGDDNAEDAGTGTEGSFSNDEPVSGVGCFNLVSNPKECTQILKRTSHLDLASQYVGLVGARSTEAMDIMLIGRSIYTLRRVQTQL